MANKHTNLNELFTDIADAIRDKTGSEETIVADNFPSEIQNIQVGVDTSDATATAADIASGKTAYINDKKITGNIEVPTLKTLSAGSRSLADSKIKLSKTVDSDFIMRNGNTVSIEDSASNFGDATASDVKSGKTFTSSAGIKVSGTYSAPTVVAENFSMSGNSKYAYFTLNRVTAIYGCLRVGSIDADYYTNVSMSNNLAGFNGNSGTVIMAYEYDNNSYDYVKISATELVFSGNSVCCKRYNSIYPTPSGYVLYGSVINDSNASAIYTR